MNGARAACWVALLALTGCKTDEPEPAEAPEIEDAGEDAGEDVEPLDVGEPPRFVFSCKAAWGSILMAAAPGAELLWYSPLPPTGDLRLLVEPDRLETTIVTGETGQCSKVGGKYSCSAKDDFYRIRIALGEREWTVQNQCNYFEDPQDIYLDAADCISDGKIVVAGDLIDYDPARPLTEVTLSGPRQDVRGSTGLSGTDDRSYILGTRCHVEDGHYACPSVGFVNDETHAVVVGGQSTTVLVPSAGCAATEPVRLDIQCPTLPAGFYVKSPSSNLERLTASYEGGAPYDCRAIVRPRSFSPPPDFYPNQWSATHLCPPAPGHERARGTYHIVATGYRSIPTESPPVYEADATDVFDGCGGSRAAVELTLKPRGS